MSTQIKRFFSRKSSARYGQGMRLNQVNFMAALKTKLALGSTGGAALDRADEAGQELVPRRGDGELGAAPADVAVDRADLRPSAALESLKHRGSMRDGRRKQRPIEVPPTLV